MLSEDELGRLCVVLVRARDPNNIGAVARAMYDFGFHDLRLVNEYPVPLERARSAIDAASVLETAREFLSVAEAVADCTLVVGTTAVGLRRKEHSLHTLAEAAPRFVGSCPARTCPVPNLLPPIPKPESPCSSAPKKPVSATKSSATATGSSPSPCTRRRECATLP